MNRLMRLLVVGLMLMAGVASSHASGWPEPPARPQYILVISLDGARPDAVQQAGTVRLGELARVGAVQWTAQTTWPPATLPAHASMLTGLAPEEHGVDWNGTRPGCVPIEAPTFLTLAEQAGYQVAMVTGKEKLCHFRQTSSLDYTFAREGDRSVVDKVISLLNGGTEVIFAHFPNPDYFGHRDGWMSETYLRELAHTDAQVGRLLDALTADGLAEQTLVIVTADHGGHNFSHGADLPEDVLIPWIISGPGVISGAVLNRQIVTMDTAATVLWALGIPLPSDMDGTPVLEAFGLTMPAGRD